MLEIITMIGAPIILSFAVLIYINYAQIKACENFSDKLREVFRIKKNKIFILILTFFGIGSMFLSHRTFGDRLETSLKLLFVFELLIAVAYVDRKKQIIPNKLMLLGFFSYFVFFAYEAIAWDMDVSILLKKAFLGLLLGGGAFALCGVLAKGSMGMGDIKLFSVLGILLGWQGVFNVILFSVVAVTFYGVIEIARKRKGRKSTVPLGPFALFGMMVAMCLGIGGSI